MDDRNNPVVVDATELDVAPSMDGVKMGVDPGLPEELKEDIPGKPQVESAWKRIESARVLPIKNVGCIVNVDGQGIVFVPGVGLIGGELRSLK